MGSFPTPLSQYCRLAVLFRLPFLRRLCGPCILAVWLTFAVSAAVAEDQNRLLQRAEAFLTGCGKKGDVGSYALVVRGLLHAGYSPEHPFLRAKIGVLLRLAPSNEIEAIQQRKVTLLIRANHLIPSAKDAQTLHAAVVSDFCNEHYRRCGVVRLPQGFTPKRSPDVPQTEREPDHLLAVVVAPPSLSRSSEARSLLNVDIVSSCSQNHFRSANVDRQMGYILVAKTVRLRN